MKKNQIINKATESLFLEHSFDAILTVDAKLQIVSLNHMACEILGPQKHKDCHNDNPENSEQPLAGLPLKKLNFRNLTKLTAAFIEDEEETRLDSTLSLNHTREQRIFDIKMSKVFSENHTIAVIFIFLREITFEVQREQRLWQSNEELSILYEISKVEVRSLKYQEILQNVLEKFSELTNLNKGFFIRRSSNSDSSSEFIIYNLDEKEENGIVPLVENNRFPLRFFREHARIYQIKRERQQFFTAAHELGFELAVSIPVSVKQQPFGSLVLLSQDTDMLRISSNMRFFDLVGQQVGLALEKAQLFNELELSFQEITSKNQQLNDELALAQKMQRGILSLNFPRKPGIHFAVKYIPSYHLSGDFYDIFEISKDKIGVLIADVCGHGINAALVTSFLKASVRDMSQDYLRPDHLLARLNVKLCDLLTNHMFVSAFYLIIDLKEQCLLYSNAGHPYPLFYQDSSNEIIDLKVDGTLLSVHKDSEYSYQRSNFTPQDRVIMYTDGLFDMKNQNGEFIPFEYIHQLTKDSADTGGYEFIDRLINRLYQFSDNEKFDDDINLIVIDFTQVS